MTTTNYAELSARQEHHLDVETARVRVWGYALGAYFTGPIWTGVIAARTKKWGPFCWGLGLGVVGLPFAFLDLGLLSSVPATVVATATMNAQVEEKRRKLQVISPEQADMLRWAQYGVATDSETVTVENEA